MERKKERKKEREQKTLKIWLRVEKVTTKNIVRFFALRRM
jgi:hypothetical protein